MRRSAFFTMATLASAAVFGQGLLDCIEPDVMRALVPQIPGEQPPVVTGALPPELSAVKLPREFSWIGSAERVTGRLDANTNAVQVTAAWRSSLPLEATREAATNALTASGWEIRSLGTIRNGGFKASFIPVPRMACRDGKTVDVNAGAMDGATYLQLVVRRGMVNSICNQPAQALRIATGGLGEYLPRLDLPAAAGPAMNLNGGASSSTGSGVGSRWASTAMDFVVPDSIDSIARHFASQIAAQGWSSDAKWSGGSTAGSSWSRRIEGGTLVLGTLSLTALGERRFNAGFRLVTLQ